MGKYKFFDLEHPPTIGAVVNWNEGCAIITGWEVNKHGVVFVCINGKLITSTRLLTDYMIEDHPAGYLENKDE